MKKNEDLKVDEQLVITRDFDKYHRGDVVTDSKEIRRIRDNYLSAFFVAVLPNKGI